MFRMLNTVMNNERDLLQVLLTQPWNNYLFRLLMTREDTFFKFYFCMRLVFVRKVTRSIYVLYNNKHLFSLNWLIGFFFIVPALQILKLNFYKINVFFYTTKQKLSAQNSRTMPWATDINNFPKTQQWKLPSFGKNLDIRERLEFLFLR